MVDAHSRLNKEMPNFAVCRDLECFRQVRRRVLRVCCMAALSDCERAVNASKHTEVLVGQGVTKEGVLPCARNPEPYVPKT